MSEEKLKKEIASHTSNKGITLIALIITIVVMLILTAVVVLIAVGENGVITKTKEARDKYREAEIIEQVEIAKAAAYDTYIVDYFSKMSNIEGVEETKENYKNEGLIVSGILNMGKLYTDLTEIFEEDDRIEIRMDNTYFELAYDSGQDEEKFKEIMGGEFTYNDIYQTSKDIFAWLDYLDNKKFYGKTTNEITDDINNIFGNRTAFRPTDEDIQNLVNNNTTDIEIMKTADALWGFLSGIILNNYYVTLNYDGNIYTITTEETDIVKVNKDKYLPQGQAAEIFEWVYVGESEIAILFYKGNETNIVIPEKIGANTVVQIGGHHRGGDDPYSFLGALQEHALTEFTGGLELTEGEDSNWQTVKTYINMAYNSLNLSDSAQIPDSVNSFESLVSYMKAYKKDGKWYGTVVVDDVNGNLIYKGENYSPRLTIPPTVQFIGSSCFAKSSNENVSDGGLAEITFAGGRDQILEIDDYVFDDCTSLASIKIEEVEFIKDNSFSYSDLPSTTKVYIKTPSGWNDSDKQAEVARIGLAPEQVVWE